MTDVDALAMSPGLRVVLDMERGLDLEDLRQRVGDYATATGYDASLSTLRERTGGVVDLANNDHRTAVLAWLRQWGCRHLSLASDATSNDALRHWSQTWAPRLPGPTVMLSELSADEVAAAAVAFGQLSEAVAGARRLATGDGVVTFGPTAAAKTLYALRPNACAPWDEPIRNGLRIGSNDAAYRTYLQLIARALTATAARAGVAVEELPARVGRPDSSPPKLIDEYLWMRITRGETE